MAEVNKPKFGVHDSTVNPQPSERDGINPNPHAQEDNDSKKANFETGSENKETSQSQNVKFGTQSQSNNEQPQESFINRIFQLQTTSFWLKQYAFSFIGFVIAIITNENATMIISGLTLLYLVNFILYPMTVTILQEIGRTLHKKPGSIGDFLLNSNYDENGASLFIVAIYWIGRFILFIIKWQLSIVIGIIGLIYMNSQSKKMGL
ncbi:MAG: hypothetical protein ABF908_02585 [Lentilactobacillus diolivorans]